MTSTERVLSPCHIIFTQSGHSESDPTGREDLVVGRVGDVGLHKKVHAAIARVEVRRVARPVHRLAGVPGGVHLDDIDVMLHIPRAAAAEGAGDGAVG